MLFSELEEIERKEKRTDERDERKLLPIDSCSQLDTGYTGRPDSDMKMQDDRVRGKKPRIGA